MSGVELKVVLVGGDEAEQRAFNRPFEDQQREAAHAYTPAPPVAGPPPIQPPEPPAAQPAGSAPPPPAPPVTQAAVPPKAPPIAPPVTPPPVSTQDVAAATQQAPDRAIATVEALAKHIQDLVALELAAKSKPPEDKQAKEERPDTAFGRLVDRIDSFVRSTEQAINKGMGRFGKTSAGKAVSAGVSRLRKVAAKTGKSLASTPVGRTAIRAGQAVGGVARRAGSRMASSRAGQAVAGALGRTAATAAAGNAAGAGGASAAGAGAAGTVAAVAAPLAAFAIVVGGAVLTVKAFMDAIHNAAGELEDLSPALAGVRADFETRRELQRLDRADRIGAGAAQLEAARGRINESMYEVQTKILEVILKFAPLIEGVLDGVNVGVRGIDTFIAQLANIWAQVNDIKMLGGNLGDNQKAQDALDASKQALIAAIREFADQAPDQFQGMDPWLAEVLKMPGPGGGGAAPVAPPIFPGNFP